MKNRFLYKTHLIVGFVSGIVVFLVCLSGALISFTEEALDIMNRKYLTVPIQNKPKASMEAVINNYRKQYPTEQMFLVNGYRQDNRSYDFFSAVKTGKKDADGNDEFGGFKMVYANPYTAEIMNVDKGTLEAIIVLVTLHTQLFMGETGGYIIQIATLLFLIQLIGGMYLWWPKSKNVANQAFKIKLNGGKKRRNYDLHRTLGFYTSAVLSIIVVTALIMAWSFIKNPVVDSLGGKSEYLELETPPIPKIEVGIKEFSYNQLMTNLLNENPATTQVSLFMPETDTTTILNGRVNDKISFLTFDFGNYFQINRYTGEKIEDEAVKAFSKNSEIMAGVLKIHMGFWGGTFVKILTSIVGLIGASLPITGFLIWWGRRKKDKIESKNTEMAKT